MPNSAPNGTLDPKDRLRIIIDSSTPLVVIETVEELRALALIQLAASELHLPVFEWSIADGLCKSVAVVPASSEFKPPPLNVLASSEASPNQPIYNTKEAAAVLEHLQSLTVEAVFVLKDLHRHLQDAVVVRRLREVAQSFSRDRRTLVLTAPAIDIPAELQHDVEYLDLPLPDKIKLQAIVEREFNRLGKTRHLQRSLDATQLQELVANLSGLTEEEAERAVAQAIVTRYGLLPDTAQDVLHAKREMLQRSGMLEFVDCSDTLSPLEVWTT